MIRARKIGQKTNSVEKCPLFFLRTCTILKKHLRACSMILRDVLPHPALREYIQCYRICHFEFDKAEDIPVKAWAPRPENILHFILRGDLIIQPQCAPKHALPSVTLIGQRTKLVQQFTGKTLLNVHLAFQPTAMHMLTGVPAHELTDQHLDASLVFGHFAKSAYDRLQQATTYTELLSVLENFAFQLVKRAQRRSPGVDSVSRAMIAEGGNTSMDALADEACLCTKQFKRKFFERVGVNPKTYSRIIRLNKAYSLKNAFPDTDWLEIAVQCGYSDYQHLAKDYKSFTGATPIELHLLERRAPENILGLSENLYRDRAARYAHRS